MLTRKQWLADRPAARSMVVHFVYKMLAEDFALDHECSEAHCHSALLG